MSDFRSKDRYRLPSDSNEEKEKEVLVGKVEDVKAAAETGKKRLIVREKGGARLAHSVEVPIPHMNDIERKKDYKFLVEEKDRERRYGYVREKRSGTRNYFSDDKPEPWGLDSLRNEKNNRFGGIGKRTEFPKE